MKFLSYLGMIFMFISLIFLIMFKSLSKKMLMSREKNSPFECGFEPLTSTRMPFSSRFFLIAILFLVFDVEITLLLPMIISMKMSVLNPLVLLVTGSVFLMILIVGLIYEWLQGALKWA